MILPRHGAELYCGVVELAAAPLHRCTAAAMSGLDAAALIDQHGKTDTGTRFHLKKPFAAWPVNLFTRLLFPSNKRDRR